jgi:DNA-directed RNA polymerase specialized sigma24 family protein
LAFAPLLVSPRDPDTVAGLAEADPAAFERFFAAWFPRVYAFAWNELRSRPHAESVTRRSLRRALEEVAELDPATPLGPWLLAHVRHELAWARRSTPP